MCLALCGMVTALSTVLLFLTGVVPFGRTVLTVLAAMLLVGIVAELGSGWAWSVYLAVSLLSGLLAANKEMVLCYLLIFGCYSVLKAIIEKRTKKAVAFLLKLAFCNASVLIEGYLAAVLLYIPMDNYEIFGVSLPWLFLILWNAAFLVYDYALSLLVMAYFKRIHPIVKKWLFLR